MASDYFHPSEIARLILGYLKQKGLTKTYTSLLRECPDLQEYWKLLYSGTVPPTSIMGLSLPDILNEFCSMKLATIRSAQRNAIQGRAELASHLELNQCVAGPNQVSPRSMHTSDAVGSSTACTPLPLSSSQTSAASIETSSTLANTNVPLNTGHSLVRGQEGTVSGIPPSNSSVYGGTINTGPKPCPPSLAMAELEDPLERLLEETKLPEKLAERINHALKDSSFLDELDKVIGYDETYLARRAEGSVASEKHSNEIARPNLDNVVAMTTSDPEFEELLSLMKQDVPSLLPVGPAGERSHDPHTICSAHSNNDPSCRVSGKTDSECQPQMSVRHQDCVKNNCTNSTPVTICDSARHIHPSNPPHSTQTTSKTSITPELPRSTNVSPVKHPETVSSSSPSKIMPPPAAPEKCSRRSKLKRIPKKSFQKPENFMHKTITVKEPVDLRKNAAHVPLVSGNSQILSNTVSQDHENNVPVSEESPIGRGVHNSITSDNFSKAVILESTIELSHSENDRGKKGDISKGSVDASSSKVSKQDMTNGDDRHLHESEASDSFRVSKKDEGQKAQTSGCERAASAGIESHDSSSIKPSSGASDVVQCNRNTVSYQKMTDREREGALVPSQLCNSCLSNDSSCFSTENVSDSVKHGAPSGEVCATTPSAVCTINENSLSVFSLIEKNIAEMHGEVFIPRHLRNQPNVAENVVTNTTTAIATDSGTNTQTNTTGVTSFKGLATTGQDPLNKSSETNCDKDAVDIVHASISASEQDQPSENHNVPNSFSPSLNPIDETRVIDNTFVCSDSDFNNRLSTPDAVLVRPIGQYPSVLQRNFQLVDECLKNCLGGLLDNSGPKPSVPSSFSPDDHGNTGDMHNHGTTNSDDRVVLNSQHPSDNSAPQQRCPGDPHSDGDEDAQNLSSGNVNSQSKESSAFQKQDSSELEKRSAEECQSKKMHNYNMFYSSNTISAPFMSGKISSTDKWNGRFLTENHHSSGQCSSMPALLPSMKKSAALPDSSSQPSVSPTSFTKPLSASYLAKPLPFMSPPAVEALGGRRKVISVDCLHSPYIPDHCKKNPSRRVTPIEVSSWTPSPLQVPSPTSPANFVIDIPSSPTALPGSSPYRTPTHSIPQSPLAQRTRAESASPVANTTCPRKSPSVANCKVGQPSFLPRDASDDDERSKSEAGSSLLVCHDDKASGSKGSSMEIKMPLSPSRRKPRRIVPKMLESYSPRGGPENSATSPSRKSAAFDDAKTVSSSSDLSTPSEVEAIRILKSYLYTFTKPQPKQEITSSGQILKASPSSTSKCSCSSRSNCKHRKGRGRRSPVSEKTGSVLSKSPSKTAGKEPGDDEGRPRRDLFDVGQGGNKTQTDTGAVINDPGNWLQSQSHMQSEGAAAFPAAAEPLTKESADGTTMTNSKCDFRSVGTVEYQYPPAISFAESSVRQAENAEAKNAASASSSRCIQKQNVSTSPRKNTHSRSGFPDGSTSVSSKTATQSFASSHLTFTGHSTEKRQAMAAQVESEMPCGNQFLKETGQGHCQIEGKEKIMEIDERQGNYKRSDLEYPETIRKQLREAESLNRKSDGSNVDGGLKACALLGCQSLLTVVTEPSACHGIMSPVKESNSFEEHGDRIPTHLSCSKSVSGERNTLNERVGDQSSIEYKEAAVGEQDVQILIKECWEENEEHVPKVEIDVSAPYFPELSNTIDFFNRLKGKCFNSQDTGEKTRHVNRTAINTHSENAHDQISTLQQGNSHGGVGSVCVDVKDADLDSESKMYLASAENMHPSRKVAPLSPDAMSMGVSLLRQAMVECDIPHLPQEGDTSMPSQGEGLVEESGLPTPAVMSQSQTVPQVQVGLASISAKNSSHVLNMIDTKKRSRVPAKRQGKADSIRPTPPAPMRPSLPQVILGLDVTFNSRYAPICPKTVSAPICPKTVSASVCQKTASTPIFPQAGGQTAYTVVYVQQAGEMIPFLIPPAGLPIMLPQAQNPAAPSIPISSVVSQPNAVDTSSKKSNSEKEVSEDQNRTRVLSHPKKKSKSSKNDHHKKESAENYTPQQKIGIRRNEGTVSSTPKKFTSSYFKKGLRARMTLSKEVDEDKSNSSTPGVDMNNTNSSTPGAYTANSSTPNMDMGNTNNSTPNMDMGNTNNSTPNMVMGNTNNSTPKLDMGNTNSSTPGSDTGSSSTPGSGTGNSSTPGLDMGNSSTSGVDTSNSPTPVVLGSTGSSINVQSSTMHAQAGIGKEGTGKVLESNAGDDVTDKSANVNNETHSVDANQNNGSHEKQCLAVSFAERNSLKTLQDIGTGSGETNSRKSLQDNRIGDGERNSRKTLQDIGIGDGERNSCKPVQDIGTGGGEDEVRKEPGVLPKESGKLPIKDSKNRDGKEMDETSDVIDTETEITADLNTGCGSISIIKSNSRELFSMEGISEEKASKGEACHVTVDEDRLGPLLVVDSTNETSFRVDDQKGGGRNKSCELSSSQTKNKPEKKGQANQKPSDRKSLCLQKGAAEKIHNFPVNGEKKGKKVKRTSDASLSTDTRAEGKGKEKRDKDVKGKSERNSASVECAGDDTNEFTSTEGPSKVPVVIAGHSGDNDFSLEAFDTRVEPEGDSRRSGIGPEEIVIRDCTQKNNHGDVTRSNQQRGRGLKTKEAGITKSKKTSSRDKMDSSKRRNSGSSSLKKATVETERKDSLLADNAKDAMKRDGSPVRFAHPESHPKKPVPPNSEDTGRSSFSLFSGRKPKIDKESQGKVHTNIFDIFKNVYTGLEKNKLRATSKEQSTAKGIYRTRQRSSRSSVISESKDYYEGTDDNDGDDGIDEDDDDGDGDDGIDEDDDDGDDGIDEDDDDGDDHENEIAQHMDTSSIEELDSSFEPEDQNPKSSISRRQKGSSNISEPKLPVTKITKKTGHEKRVVSGQRVVIRVIDMCEEVIKCVLADRNPFPIYNGKVESPSISKSIPKSTHTTKKRKSATGATRKLSLKRVSSPTPTVRTVDTVAGECPIPGKTSDAIAGESPIPGPSSKDGHDTDDREELDRAVQALQQADMSWTHLDWTNTEFAVPRKTSCRHASPVKGRSSPLKGHSSPLKGHHSPLKCHLSLKGHSSPLKGHSSPLKGHSSPLKGHSSPLKGQSSLLKGHSSPLKGHSSPFKGLSSPLKGHSSPLKGHSSPLKGHSSPLKDHSSPLKDHSSPLKGLSSPLKGHSSPLKGHSSPPKGHTFRKPYSSPAKHQHSQDASLPAQGLDDEHCSLKLKASTPALCNPSSGGSHAQSHRTKKVSSKSQAKKHEQNPTIAVDLTTSLKPKVSCDKTRKSSAVHHSSETCKKRGDSEKPQKRKHSDSPSGPSRTDRTGESSEQNPSRKKHKRDNSHKHLKIETRERTFQKEKSVQPSSNHEHINSSASTITISPLDQRTGSAMPYHPGGNLHSPIEEGNRHVIPNTISSLKLGSTSKNHASYLFTIRETDLPGLGETVEPSIQCGQLVSKSALLDGLELLSAVAVDADLSSKLSQRRSSHSDDRMKRWSQVTDTRSAPHTSDGMFTAHSRVNQQMPSSPPKSSKLCGKSDQRSTESEAPFTPTAVAAVGVEPSCCVPPSGDLSTSQAVQGRHSTLSSTPVSPMVASNTASASNSDSPATCLLNKTPPSTGKSITPTAMNRLLKKLYKGKKS